jgi:hypothetical protein
MIWPAIIAGVAAIIAAALGYVNRRMIYENNNKLNEIHVLVNSRLDDALTHISELQEIIKESREQAAENEDDNAV